MLTPCDRSNDIERATAEDRIHKEFWAAYAAWEEAPEERKAEASLRLKRTVRQLYDFVVRGIIPQETARHAGAFN
jgi:hypothetical protein